MDPDVKQLVEQQAARCSVFSNPRRVMILWTLLDGEKPVSEIAEDINTSLQNTSQHLRIMKDNHILATRRDAQTIYYRISEAALADVCLIQQIKNYQEAISSSDSKFMNEKENCND